MEAATLVSRFLRELSLRQCALTAVHRDRSVTATAQKLHPRQPAVTLQIRNLQTLAGRRFSAAATACS
jgi:LysR family transcriptional regulator for metE and metH